MYNVYNAYIKNIRIGIAQLNAFSCANNKCLLTAQDRSLVYLPVESLGHSEVHRMALGDIGCPDGNVPSSLGSSVSQHRTPASLGWSLCLCRGQLLSVAGPSAPALSRQHPSLWNEFYICHHVIMRKSYFNSIHVERCSLLVLLLCKDHYSSFPGKFPRNSI